MRPVEALITERLEQAEISAGSFADFSRAVLLLVEANLTANRSEPPSLVYRAHRQALRNWLGRYRISEEMSAQQMSRGLREATYHLRQIGEWRQAVGLMRASLRVHKGLALQKWRRFEEMQDGKRKNIH